MKKVTLKIGGMHCASCSSALERLLNKNTFVSKAVVNLATEEASVEFDDKNIDLLGIEKIINKAGFTLETEEKESFEDRTLSLRLKVSIVLDIILLLVAMGPMMGMPFFIPMTSIWYGIIQVILVVPIMLCGYTFFTRGYSTLFRLRPNMDSLVALGTTASFLFSLYNLIFNPGHFHHALYFEGAGTIITLVMIGKTMEARSKKKSKDAVEKLIALQPSSATRIKEDGSLETITLKDISLGNRLLVKPGEQIPCDGKVVKGNPNINEAMLTGESIPQDKFEGSDVFSGTINLHSSFEMEATKVGKETALQQIIKFVKDASSTKAPIARIADKVSLYFVPIVILISIGTLLAWWLSGNDISFALTNAVAVLVIACPCALGLATPIAIMVASGKGAKLGLLFKSAASLEELKKIDTVVFDKTGTLTNGNLECVAYFGKDEDLALIASSENHSEHPLGKAVATWANDKGLKLSSVDDFKAIPGKGLQSTVNGKDVVVGNRILFSDLNIKVEKDDEITELENKGKTVLIGAIDGAFASYIALEDTVRDDSIETVKKLKELGINVVMITGDTPTTAKAIANVVGIDTFYASILPENKASIIKELQSKGQKVAMVGDGINDSPALVTSDVALSVGSASDVALSSSDIVIVNNHLTGIIDAIKLSKATIKNIKENLFWAFFYNSLGIPVAMGLLTLFGGPALNPMLASLAMSFSSVCVVLNALRLNRFRP